MRVYMGNRSTVILALDKESYIKHAVLLKDLPDLFKEFEYTNGGDAHYFIHKDITWYNAHENIQKAEQWLSDLEEEDTHREQKKNHYVKSSFCCLEMPHNNEQECQEWGTASDFEIYPERMLTTPIGTY